MVATQREDVLQMMEHNWDDAAKRVWYLGMRLGAIPRNVWKIRLQSVAAVNPFRH